MKRLVVALLLIGRASARSGIEEDEGSKGLPNPTMAQQEQLAGSQTVDDGSPFVGPTRVITTAFSTDSGAPQPGAFICVMGDRHIFRINRCGALQPAAAACGSSEPW